MKVEIQKNGEVIEVKELNEGQYTIGRSSSNDICLDSSKISKQHGLLVIKGGKAAILDMGSSNGTFVNGVLIKKQRIESGDIVSLGEFQLRILKAFAMRGVNVRGNLAEKLEENYVSDEKQSAPEVAQAASARYQAEIAQVIENKVLIPLYGLMRTADWRWILGSIIISTLVVSVLVAARPLYVWSTESSKKEALERAHTVINQVVRENFRSLQKGGDFARLSVDAWESVRGFKEIYILDGRTGTILAPMKLYNKSLNDGYALIALKKVTEDRESEVTVEHSNGSFIVAQPIPQAVRENIDEVGGAPSTVVLGKFEISDSITSVFEPVLEALIFAVFLGLLAYFLILKMVTHPIRQIQEQLDSALRGEPVSVACEAKFVDLENLAQVINFSVSKLQQAGGNMQSANLENDSENEDDFFVKTIQEIDVGVGDGVLLLDKEKKVKFVGHVIEELLGMKNQYAQGQNISDCCKDPGFAGTVIDLAERVVSSLGENQNANLDINGVNRPMAAIGHRSQSGEIRLILITVRMEGG